MGWAHELELPFLVSPGGDGQECSVNLHHTHTVLMLLIVSCVYATQVLAGQSLRTFKEKFAPSSWHSGLAQQLTAVAT